MFEGQTANKAGVEALVYFPDENTKMETESREMQKLEFLGRKFSLWTWSEQFCDVSLVDRSIRQANESKIVFMTKPLRLD